MPNPEDIQQLGNLQLSETNNIGLAQGDSQNESSWESLVNIRLRVEGNYVFWKTRGGTTAVHSFFGNILTVYPFQSVIGNTVYEYLAVHTSGGKVFLWDINAQTSDEIISSGMSTSKQVQFSNIGRFLFVFDYDAGATKYYDLANSSLFDYLTYNKAYIGAVNFLAEGVTNNNIWGFEEGQRILVFPNSISSSGDIVADASGGDGVFDPNDYDLQSFLYRYEGGKYLVDSNGKEYKSNQYLTFPKGAAPLDYTTSGTGSDWTIEKAYIPVDEAGEAAFESYVTTIDSLSGTKDAGFIGFKDPVGVERSTQVGGVADTELSNTNLVYPYTDDMENLVGQPSNKRLSEDGSTVVENEKYSNPRVYRQYVIVEILNDGSVTVPGKPYQVEGTPQVINQDAGTMAKFTLSSPSQNVAKRYLCATRWQPTPQRAFDPSNEQYSNSPLFIVKEVNINDNFVDDRTPDRKLLRPITEFLPTVAGVADLFGPKEIKPMSVAQFKGSLMMGGYEVSRPIPDPYVNPLSETDGNIHLDITPTTRLSNNMALAFQFEYTDGKRSNIVETEEFLQEGSAVQSQPVNCEQYKASASHDVTQGCQQDGKLSVTYDGVTVEIELTTASHSTPANAAEAIRQAIQASNAIMIAASITSSPTIEYEEKRYGEEFNNNVINFEPVPVAAEGYVDAQDNQLVQTAATGHLDVNANNLASSSSEDHIITIGAESTAAITISDTDTLEGIVDKYVSEINTGGNITGWTASKVDNGDGTWRCLITQDTPDESGNGTTISVDNVDVDVTTQDASGGNDGEETHTLTVGANTTGNITILHSDTVQDIAQKYVDAINNDGTISGSWTASLVDNGDGSWRCLITSDTPGSADSGTTISVSKSDTVSGGSQVATASQNSDGGSDTPGVTFDTQDPTLTGAQEPEPLPPTGYFAMTNNYVSSGDSDNYRFFIGDTVYQGFTVDSGMTKKQLAETIKGIVDSEFTGFSGSIGEFYVDGTKQWVAVIEADDKADEGTEFGAYPITEDDRHVNFKVAAPGESFRDMGQLTNGPDSEPENPGVMKTGGSGCNQSTASIEATANNLGSGASEDHTVVLAGVSSDPVTISDTDSLNDIALAWQSAIQNKPELDQYWDTQVDGGTLTLLYRQYGTVGDDKTVDITGETNVSISIDSPTSGGGPKQPSSGTMTVSSGSDGTSGIVVGLLFTAPIFDGGYYYNEYSVSANLSATDVAAELVTALQGDTTVSDKYDITQNGVDINFVSTAQDPDYNGTIEQVDVDTIDTGEISKEVSAGDGEQNTGYSEVIDLKPLGAAIGNSVDADFIFGPATDGTNWMEITVEESADGKSGWTAVSGTVKEDPAGTWDSPSEDTTVSGSFTVNERYVRVKVTVGASVGYGGCDATGAVQITQTTGKTDNGVALSNTDLTGGATGTVAVGSAVEVNANRMQIHSLNALVSKVYVLGRVNDGTKKFHLIDQFGISDPESHGMMVGLPNTKEDLDDIETNVFSQPSSTEVLEKTTFQSNIIVGTPFQQMNISGQQSIVDNSKIQRVIPIDFDDDKSVMRFRVGIFTDQNIQQAYYVEEPTEFGSVFSADVEISSHGIVATNREGITTIGRSTFFQSRNGLHIWEQGQERKLLDTRRYDVLDNNKIVDVVHNEEMNEYWFISRNNMVVVFDPETSSFKRMRYQGPNVGTLRAGTFYDGNFYIGLDSQLSITDDESLADDLGQGASDNQYVTGEAITKHLGNSLNQVKLIEVAVEGQNFNCDLQLDLQPERRESVTSDWNKSFNIDYQGSEKTLKMHGTPWEINRRAIMPRMRLSFYNNGDGHLAGVRTKQVLTQNKGKSRQ